MSRGDRARIAWPCAVPARSSDRSQPRAGPSTNLRRPGLPVRDVFGRSKHRHNPERSPLCRHRTGAAASKVSARRDCRGPLPGGCSSSERRPHWRCGGKGPIYRSDRGGLAQHSASRPLSPLRVNVRTCKDRSTAQRTADGSCGLNHPRRAQLRQFPVRHPENPPVHLVVVIPDPWRRAVNPSRRM